MVPAMPALATMTSIRPKRSSVPAAARSTACQSPASQTAVWTGPRSPSAEAARSSAAASMSHRLTAAPEDSIRSAVA